LLQHKHKINLHPDYSFNENFEVWALANGKIIIKRVFSLRILVVEDEKKVASFIKKGLEEEGYAVDLAADGREGLVLALDGIHDLIVLDLNLPKLDGLEVLQELRKAKIKAPVLLLSIRAMIEDKVLGLDAGADDYLTKPFSFQELLARIRALFRRRHATTGRSY
jgi:DNA-binding response OmpR family regulator